MRIAFAATLLERARRNKDIILLTADLGFSVFEQHIDQLPNQYINVGIAEQNMTGLAAGMAMENKIPFIYSIVPFTTMRNFEQIRNDICYQNLNVKIIGVGAGFAYGPYGHTHHGLEDIGILRTLPNLTIFSPGDPHEARFATNASVDLEGPVYIRLGRAGEPIINKNDQKLTVGKANVISEGSEFAILATGSMVYTALQVVKALKKKNISGTLASIHTIKPLDNDFVINTARKVKAVLTLEEHSIIGGLGSAVSEVLAENGISTPFKRIGVPDRFTKVIGTQEYMRKANGLLAGQIEKIVVHLLGK